MQQSHPPSLLGDFEDVFPFVPVLGGCVPPRGFGRGMGAAGQEVFISEISLAGSCGGRGGRWVQGAELSSAPGLLVKLEGTGGSLSRMRVCGVLREDGHSCWQHWEQWDQSWAVCVAVTSVGTSRRGVGTAFPLIFFGTTAAPRWPVPRQGVFKVEDGGLDGRCHPAALPGQLLGTVEQQACGTPAAELNCGVGYACECWTRRLWHSLGDNRARPSEDGQARRPWPVRAVVVFAGLLGAR